MPKSKICENGACIILPSCWAQAGGQAMGQMNYCVHENSCQCEFKVNFHPMKLFKDLLAFFFLLLPQRGVEWGSDHLRMSGLQFCPETERGRAGAAAGKLCTWCRPPGTRTRWPLKSPDWKDYFDRFSIQEHSLPVIAFHLSYPAFVWQLRPLQYFMPQSQLLASLQ